MIQSILNAKQLTDFVFVRVPSKHNDRIGSLHLSLDPALVHQGYLPSNEEGDKPFNEEQHVRTCADVIAVPDRINRKVVREIYQGTPRQLTYMPHEQISATMANIPKSAKPAYERIAKQSYRCGNFTEQYEYYPETTEIKVGDKIYFEYTSLLNDANYVGEDKDGIVFMVPMESIYCYVRDGRINMVNGWVFVESVTKEQLSKYIILVNNKPQHYVGKIAAAGKWYETFVPNEGDNCLFLRTLFTVKNWESVDSDYEISGYQVEGKLYYPMRNWEIMAVERDGEWQSVNEFVKIIPELINEVSKVRTVEYDPNKSQKYEPGVLFIPQGSNVHDKKKKLLNYGIGELDGRTVMYGKSQYYLYLDDLKVLFIHRKDLFGELIIAE